MPLKNTLSSIQRASPWFVMSLVLALLVVVGPLDYFVVHRILKKPHLTWVTFPVFVAISGLLASGLANTSNGSIRHANQLDIVNVDVTTARATGRHFVTLYSPTTSQSSVTVDALPLVKAPKDGPTTELAWQGVPESAFGGMLRETGLEQGATYQRQPEGQLTHLPVMQWSSKALVAECVQSVEGLADSDLRASATGRLTGTMTHRFSVPIEDWMLVYKNVVYRQLKKKDDPQSLPLLPNQVWRVEQPSVYSREIRPYLTGMITVATPRFGEPTVTDFSNRRTNYDPLSLDPANLVRILTFHDEAGGERYTGLTNLMLSNEDCSQLLKLGRAILFGRINHSVATIQQDQTSLTPDRQMSFVRMIFPVARSSEVIRQLPRVVPDN